MSSAHDQQPSRPLAQAPIDRRLCKIEDALKLLAEEICKDHEDTGEDTMPDGLCDFVNLVRSI